MRIQAQHGCGPAWNAARKTVGRQGISPPGVRFRGRTATHSANRSWEPSAEEIVRMLEKCTVANQACSSPESGRTCRPRGRNHQSRDKKKQPYARAFFFFSAFNFASSNSKLVCLNLFICMFVACASIKTRVISARFCDARDVPGPATGATPDTADGPAAAMGY